MANTGIETTTWHDQRPSHPTRPDWLIDAQNKADAAWKAHELAIDHIYFPGREVEITATERAHIERLYNAALEAESKLDICFRAYHAGTVPVHVIELVEISHSQLNVTTENHICANVEVFQGVLEGRS